MEYSPINYRRMDWFRYNLNGPFPWQDLRNGFSKFDNKSAFALIRNAQRGYLPQTDYRSPRSYLSYYLE